ncbi:YopT-type cysteine protease domain-containing protein [Polaromonas sp.]|uniref:YopT-type cysteine protease domain-containing protein n=1 Tax=Polaromonas sp. TaxID=1869339 RepID=UPI003CB703A0
MPWGNFDTENTRSTASGPGVCMAMTCHWIARVYESADRQGVIQGLDNANQLRALRHHVFNQAAFENRSGADADAFIFGQYGLRGQRSVHRATSKTLIAAIRGTAGTYLFGALGGGSGHAMGIVHDGKEGWIFFDPNVGQRVFASESAFTKHLVSELADYSDLRDEFEIYRVIIRLRGG